MELHFCDQWTGLQHQLTFRCKTKSFIRKMFVPFTYPSIQYGTLQDYPDPYWQSQRNFRYCIRIWTLRKSFMAFTKTYILLESSHEKDFFYLLNSCERINIMKMSFVSYIIKYYIFCECVFYYRIFIKMLIGMGDFILAFWPCSDFELCKFYFRW